MSWGLVGWHIFVPSGLRSSALAQPCCRSRLAIGPTNTRPKRVRDPFRNGCNRAYPANIDPEHFRLVAPFESDQRKWNRSSCINIGDPQDRRVYGLITSFTSTEYGKKAVVETFENLFYRYMQHPEAKSLGPDGEPCTAETRGLLG